MFLFSKVYYTFVLLAVSSRGNKWYDESLELKIKKYILKFKAEAWKMAQAFKEPRHTNTFIFH